MNILIVLPSVVPAPLYGGTERVVWYLGRELVAMGHQVVFLTNKGSYCDFAPLLHLDHSQDMAAQIPEETDVVHFNYVGHGETVKPSLTTVHVNVDEGQALDVNSVFVSRDHAQRHGSTSFVYNGMDWNDYGHVDFRHHRDYFHFLGNAAWRVKNVKGAIDVIRGTRAERLKVLGGRRLNFKMGFRLTLSTRVDFHGMVGGEEKNGLLRHSKGLVFPVRWPEPFGLAITESLYFGCPVFGTPYGSLPELVPKEVGYLGTRATELSAAIEEAGAYSRERCHEYARDVFNSRTMALAYLDKYEKVLNGEKLNPVPPVRAGKPAGKFLPWD